jgi:hypothetical protein
MAIPRSMLLEWAAAIGPHVLKKVESLLTSSASADRRRAAIKLLRLCAEIPAWHPVLDRMLSRIDRRHSVSFISTMRRNEEKPDFVGRDFRLPLQPSLQPGKGKARRKGGRAAMEPEGAEAPARQGVHALPPGKRSRGHERPPLPQRGALPMTRRGSIQMARTGSIPMARMGSIQMTRTGSIPMTRSGSIPMTRTGSIPLPRRGLDPNDSSRIAFNSTFLKSKEKTWIRNWKASLKSSS